MQSLNYWLRCRPTRLTISQHVPATKNIHFRPHWDFLPSDVSNPHPPSLLSPSQWHILHATFSITTTLSLALIHIILKGNRPGQSISAFPCHHSCLSRCRRLSVRTTIGCRRRHLLSSPPRNFSKVEIARDLLLAFSGSHHDVDSSARIFSSFQSTTTSPSLPRACVTKGLKGTP